MTNHTLSSETRPKEKLPIVFKQSPGNALLVLALGLAMLGGGILMSLDDSTLVPVFGLFRVPRPAIGWLVALPGLVAVLTILNALLRGRPRLELTEHGIVLKRMLGGETRVPWRDVERVEIKHMETMGNPGVLGRVKFDSVAIIATDGRRVPISELAPAEVMRDTIMRVKRRGMGGSRDEHVREDSRIGS